MPVVPAAAQQYSGVPEVAPQPGGVGYQQISATPAAFGAESARAVSALGTQLARTGDTLAEDAIQTQMHFNSVAAADYSNKYSDEETKVLYGDPASPGDTGFFGKRGEEAMRDFPGTRDRLLQARENFRGVMQNEHQRMLFDNETRNAQRFALSRMGAHYDTEYKQYQAGVATATAKNAANAVGQAVIANDPIAEHDALEKAFRAQDQILTAQGLAGNEEARAARYAEFVKAPYLKQKVEALASTNPVAALAFLEKHSDWANKDEFNMLQKGLQAQSRELRAAVNSGVMAPIGDMGKGVGSVSGTGTGHVAPKAERIAFAREYSASKGINPDAVVATMAGEGLGSYTGDGGTSFGDLQLHVGGGMGDAALAAGINIRDPNTWKDQLKFGIDQMVANKDQGAAWFSGQWHGAPSWAAQSFASNYGASPAGVRGGIVKAGINPPEAVAPSPVILPKGTPESVPMSFTPGGTQPPDQLIAREPKFNSPLPPLDPGELPDAQVPGMADALEHIMKTVPADHPIDRLDAVKYARKQYNMIYQQQQQKLRQQKQDHDAEQGVLMQEYQERIFGPNPPTPQEITANKKLDDTHQRTLVGFIESQGRADPAAAHDSANKLELYSKMLLPYGTEGKITTRTPIDQALIAKQITVASHDYLVKHLTDADKVEFEKQAAQEKRLLAEVQGSILGPLAASNPTWLAMENDKAVQAGGIGPSGRLDGYIDRLHERMRTLKAENKDPMAVFDRSSPEYFGTPGKLQGSLAPMQAVTTVVPKALPDAEAVMKMELPALKDWAQQSPENWERAKLELMRRNMLRPPTQAPFAR